MIINESFPGRVHAVAITDVGARHTAMGLPNQDCSAFYFQDDQFFMAVSDGVGSCKHAEAGSKLACRISRIAFEHLLEGSLPWNGNAIVKEICALWKSNVPSADPLDYCATLKAAFVKRGLLIAVSIGDGLLLAADSRQQLHAKEKASDFLNETVCLYPGVKEKPFWYQEMFTFPGACAIFLCSDGIANALLENRESLLIETIRSEIGMATLREELTELFEDARLMNADDKTLGVVKYDY